MDFVHMMEGYYLEKTGQHAELDELIRAAVERWLFAREVVRLGLTRHLSQDALQDLPEDPGEMAAWQVDLMRDMYMTHLVMEEPVPEEAILSYYMVFPNRFVIADESGEIKEDESENRGSSLDTEPEIIPYSEVRQHIHRILVHGKLPQIRRDAFTRLMDKYNVEMYN